MIAIERLLRELGEHRVRLGGSLAADHGGSPQAGARVLVASERAIGARERDLVLRGDGRGEPQPAQPLEEVGRTLMLAVACRHCREPREGVRLQRIELERMRPGGHRRGALEMRPDRRPRARRGAPIAARLGQPSDIAPRAGGGCWLRPREDGRCHLGDHRVVGRERASGGKLAGRARAIAQLVREYGREAQPELHDPRGVRRHRGPGANEPYELGPALLVREPVGQRIRGLRRRRIVLQRQLVELRRDPGIEHPEQPRPGERRE